MATLQNGSSAKHPRHEIGQVIAPVAPHVLFLRLNKRVLHVMVVEEFVEMLVRDVKRIELADVDVEQLRNIGSLFGF